MERAHRWTGLDFLRGVAVVLMVAANLSPALCAPRHILFRLLASCAAPLFVGLSGLMVGLLCERPSSTLWYSLKRGGLLWLVAALVDLLAWGNAPFITFDVLYLIGASLPLCTLLCRLPLAWGVACTVVVLGMGPTFILWHGYEAALPAASLRGMHALGQGEVGEMVEAFLFDGWFPLFPWAGLAGMGALLGKTRLRAGRGLPTSSVLVGAVLMVMGALWWAVEPGPAHQREGYAELFYPPTPGFLLCSVGACLVVFTAALQRRAPRWTLPVQVLGEASLLAYVAHCLILAHVVHPFLEDVSLAFLVIATLAVVAVLIGLAFVARALKGRWPSKPLVFKMLLGG
ncbi:MAG: DUF1624 domain-containing protein [Myxococcota bacterium]|jgi:uncharacterized membrane protein|nr:DUF1624 domain-containing protein [Myxococcota bacterium]